MVTLPKNILPKEDLKKVYIDCCRRRNGSNQGIVVAFLDGNGIKRINDNYGHLVGDEVITRIATILSSSIRVNKGDQVIRFGGDEFVLILNDFNSDIEDVRQFMLRILGRIRNDSTLNSKVGGVSVSAGAVRFSPRFDSLEKVIAEADRLMYIAKKSPANHLVISGDLAADKEERLAKEARKSSPHAVALRLLFDCIFNILKHDVETSNSSLLKESMRDVWRSQQYKLTSNFTINEVIKLVKSSYNKKTTDLFL